MSDHVGGFDVVINNAAIYPSKPFEAYSIEEMQLIQRINVDAGIVCVQVALPHMKAAGRGRIINISSGAAFLGQPRALGYSASKGAVKMLTQSMAADLGSDGIRVNAIAPGVIVTPMTDATRADPQRLERFMVRIPSGRLGEPREIAGAAVFLASDLASYVNGVTLPVDGGTLAV